MTSTYRPYRVQPSRGLLTPADLAQLRTTDLLRDGEENTKIRKGLTPARPISVKTLSLAPSWLSGYQCCPYASAACGGMDQDGFTGFCVGTTGNARYANVTAARIRKARYFFEHHEECIRRLVWELECYATDPTREGHTRAVRLNTFSDIPWERVRCRRQGVTYPGIPHAFPELTFYDYTKDVTRIRGDRPANLHITFSLSEGNDAHALEALAAGVNVAVVFHVTKAQPLPAAFADRPVIDGDGDDFRFLDPAGGFIVGLKAKGPARRDCSGFVRDHTAELDPARPLTIAGRPALTLTLAAD